MTKQSCVTLNHLLDVLHLPSHKEGNKVISGLTLDSRKLNRGDLFVAVSGHNQSGAQFIGSAIDRGAAAVLFDEGIEYEGLAGRCSAVPVISVKELKSQLGLLADRFYQHPSQQLKIFGVTGTNGKTSCSWFLSQLLTEVGYPCGVMGTLGTGMISDLHPAMNTTQDVLSNHYHLGQQKKNGAKAVAMEVSSHGLHQHRVDGIRFEAGLFTNISRDHLDYHGTMDNYARAKSLLFSECVPRIGIINRDDHYASLMLDACRPDKTMPLTYSLSNKKADVYAEDIELHEHGIKARICSPWGNGLLESDLLGRFSLENLMAVMTALGSQGIDWQDVLHRVQLLKNVPGRMQCLGGHGMPRVIVDYAHTPDALVSVLAALKDHGAGRLVCVFGCGGDRDTGKRPLMAQAALAGADKVVVTSDNPRTEDPLQIIKDVTQDITDLSVMTIVDRSEAIAYAIDHAQADDLILVAGKGHENYQEVMNIRHHFDDAEQVLSALENWKGRVRKGQESAA
ncbi:UDP-N-acetylmuramoyl-L-alanyl-D-glutamate--2,6-diaminopimelate ligase [invertebrate metagenome]|uniref:UDP-N-acetylmuramoyl-L-alanyl-D-glutamate--2, 6-diaminopimelate ligase n=1 Tax=invertebrate metagenome TaxID=1711999 RepID=A0A2H9TAY6_9ZZZZ